MKIFFGFMSALVIGHNLGIIAELPLGKDILLVINYNHPHYESIPLLKKIYSPCFPNIVFYGPHAYSEINLCHHHVGFFAYIGLADAMQRYPNYKGYLQVHDDCIINYWNFDRFDLNKIWISKINTTVPLIENGILQWDWSSHIKLPAAKSLYAKLNQSQLNILAENCGPNTIHIGYSDIIYIPCRLKNEAITLFEMAYKESLFLEVAIPTVCACLENKENWEIFDGICWNATIQNYNKKLDHIHPIKLSNPINRQFIEAQFTNA